ncbi:MAG: type IV toxin-antitoxin system AbiEi family antitoxin domain-containing protein [Gammaproteobacteria bacterium]
MTSEPRSKLNRLLTAWPQGTVAVSRWLEAKGAYQQLVHEYEKSGWIRRIGHGAYMRAGDSVEWSGGLHALHAQLKLPVHAGAKTALRLQGYGHFLPMGKGGTVSLFASPGTRLPAWFRKYDWGAALRSTTTTLFADNPNTGLTKKELASYAITISAPERAIMEVLYLVPEEESYEEAALLMEGLTTLRPRLVQSLLEQCRSVKVKRLFMVLAEACNHAWVKKLDLSKVDFGKGKRMLVKNGQFSPKYNVYVPGHGGQPQTGVPPTTSGSATISQSSEQGSVAEEIKGDSPMPINKIVDQKRVLILKLAEKHGARNVRVFGSVSRGDTGPESDIDILVDLEPGRSLMDLGGLLMDLEDLLGRKVDVVTEKGLHWYIRDKVLKEAVRL